MNDILVISCYSGQWDDSWEHPVCYALNHEEAQNWIDKQMVIDNEQRQVDLKLSAHYLAWAENQPTLDYNEDPNLYESRWQEYEAQWQTEFEKYCLANNIDPTQYDEHTNKGDSYPEPCWYKISSDPIKHCLNGDCNVS